MTGWLLILALLVLGGVLATLGDRLGSRVGKARLSLFNMRPRRTAVVITVLTGSLISAVSLGLMLLVSQRLRVGLFELDQLQARLGSTRAELEAARRERALADEALVRARGDLAQARGAATRAEADRAEARRQVTQARRRSEELRSELAPLRRERRRLEQERERLSRDIAAKDADIRRTDAELRQLREQISRGEAELQDLEQNLIALRRGDVVISSGQPLVTVTLRLESPDQATDTINRLLQQANLEAYRRVLPGEEPKRQILLVPRADIVKLEEIIRQPGTWVVSILSAGNVLRGESTVYAFPDVRPNRTIAEQGEVLASTVISPQERSLDQLRGRLNVLLASSLATAQRRGSLSSGVQFDVAQANRIVASLRDGQGEGDPGSVLLEAVSRRQSGVADPIAVELRLDEQP